MLWLIVRRVLMVIPTLLIVTFGVFLLVKLVPRDPAVAAAGGDTATLEQIAEKREELHLNDPLLSQYWRWVSHAATGDLGDSYLRHTSVSDDLEEIGRAHV